MAMKKIGNFKKDNGDLLVVWETPKGNLVGKVYEGGIEKRGKWSMRATFKESDGDANVYRVCEYFGFHL